MIFLRIIVDTSALNPDLTLERAQGRLLVAAAQNGELELVIPEVVVLEAVNLFRRRLEELSRSVVSAHRGYRLLGVDFQAEPPDAADAVTSYEAGLRTRLRDAGARTPNPPQLPHIEIAQRAIERRKPFDGKGRGYRDTLIWLQVLEEAIGDQVVLVTENTKDFAGDDKVTLAAELADELEGAGFARDRVRLSTSLTAVVRDHVEPSVQAVTRLNVLLADEGFRSQIYEAVNESVLYREVEAPEDEELRVLDVREVQIGGVQEVRDLEIDEAYVDGDHFAFNIGGTLVADTDFYPFKYEIGGADVPGVTVTDWDWNESVALASKALEFGFEGFGSYDPNTEHVELVDVWLVY